MITLSIKKENKKEEYLIKYVKIIIIVAILIFCWVENISVVFQTRVWSIKDEMQHFDYINAISEGYFPKSDRLISDYTNSIIPEPAWQDSFWIARGYRWNLSWEANQPPLYYAILAIPNIILKKYSVSSETNIYILRSITLFMVFCAVIILLFAAKSKISFWHQSALLSAIIISYIAKDYITLSNDNLSVLFGALIFYLFTRNNGEVKLIIWLVALSSFAAVFVKLSNALLLVPCGLLVLRHQKLFTKKDVLRVVGLLLLFPAVKFLLIDGNVATNTYFNFRGTGLINFLRIYFAQMLNLSESYSLWVGLFLISVLIYTMVKSLRLIGVISIGTIFQSTASIILLSAIFLNFTVPGIHWGSFRHYAAVYPFVISGFLSSFGYLKKELLKRSQHNEYY
jgi:hypothetical protein